MRTSWLIALGCAACVETHAGPGISGSRADMTTQAGTYSGYRVVTACASPSTSVEVIGTGPIVLTTPADIEAAGHELFLLVEPDFPSVWGGGGYSAACEPGGGTLLELDDWHAVDALVLWVGSWLAYHHFTLQVAITVGARDVPDAE